MHRADRSASCNHPIGVMPRSVAGHKLGRLRGSGSGTRVGLAGGGSGRRVRSARRGRRPERSPARVRVGGWRAARGNRRGAPTRRARLAIVVLGACIGVPIFLGGLLSGVPVLAVAAILGLGVGSAQVAGRFRFGTLAMNLSLPMAGVGLSYSAGKAAGAAALIVVGSACACAISMLLPEQRGDASPRARRPPAAAPTLDYGIRLGAAGATAAAIGFVLDLDHVGWACAAALLVMRPAAEMQRLRSVGRIVSVFLGAVAAVALVHAGPPAPSTAWPCCSPWPAWPGCTPAAGTWPGLHHVPRLPAPAVLAPAGRRVALAVSACWKPCSASASPTCSGSCSRPSRANPNSATALWTRRRGGDMIVPGSLDQAA